MTSKPTTIPAPLAQLAKLSNFYGKNPDFVLAGGGNTSVKIGDTLYIKGSGTELARITAEQFVALDRAKVAQTLIKKYSSDPGTREDEIKNDLLAARHVGCSGRPSVETTLHNMFQAPFVVHLHPWLVNTIACGRDGEKIVAKLFGKSAAWLGYTDPGYTLAKAVEKVLVAYRKAHKGLDPDYLFIQNHGPFIPAVSPADARRKITALFVKLRTFHARKPANPMGTRASAIRSGREQLIRRIAPALRATLAENDAPKTVVFDDSSLVLDFVATANGKRCLADGPMTPDQIVYCKSFPLWVPCSEGEDPEVVAQHLVARFEQFRRKHGYDPKVVALEGLGVFAIGETPKAARTVRDVFVDALKIVKGSFAAGGPHFMTARQYRFIDNWEVEQYRRKVAAAAAGAGRLANKIAVVVGAGGPAGKRLALDLSAEGATVALLDGNLSAIRKTADAILAEKGPGAALAFKADPSAGSSVQRAANRIARAAGGVDLLVHIVSPPKAETDLSSDPDLSSDAIGRDLFTAFKAFAPFMAIQAFHNERVQGSVIQIIRETSGASLLYRLAVDSSGIGAPANSVSVFGDPDRGDGLADAIISLLQPASKDI